jgi:hypothetical protein
MWQASDFLVTTAGVVAPIMVGIITERMFLCVQKASSSFWLAILMLVNWDADRYERQLSAINV